MLQKGKFCNAGEANEFNPLRVIIQSQTECTLTSWATVFPRRR